MLSADQENDTDVLAITGASVALALSEIPFQKTIASVRIGLVDGQFVVNPTFKQRKDSKLDLIVAGSADGLVMVEAGAKEVTEEQVVEALETAHAAIKQIVAAIDDLAKEVGKKKLVVAKKEIAPDFYKDIEAKVFDPLAKAMRIRDKLENYETVDLTLKGMIAELPEETEAEKKADAKAVFKELKEKVLREEVLTRGVRLDGRKFDEIRPIWIETSVLPRTHGSAVFTRGETQALVTCTLGTADDAQKIESFEGETWKSFMLHYNFPPFSVGEVGRMTGPGRREIGHGALAERALTPMMPAEEQFPYTVRDRVGHPRIERFLVDGVCLRRLAGHDGRRGPDQAAPWPASRWGWSWTRRPASTPCSPTSRAPKTTTATWISRSPARPRASRRCRWTSRSAASPPR